MGRITQILFENGINMNTLITNDSAEFGIIRMLVSDTDLAANVLQKAINLDYLYVTYNTLSRLPVAILKAVDLMEVEEFLQARGYKVLERID